MNRTMQREITVTIDMTGVQSVDFAEIIIERIERC